jgi:hypothetical protein
MATCQINPAIIVGKRDGMLYRPDTQMGIITTHEVGSMKRPQGGHLQPREHPDANIFPKKSRKGGRPAFAT